MQNTPDFNDSSQLWNARPALNITSIRNRIIEDPDLSYRAKGIAIYLLSKPQGWKVQITDLRRHGKEGRDAIYAALRELRQHGYALYRAEIPGIQRAGWSISDLPHFEKLENNPNEEPNPEKPNVATGTMPETPSSTPRPEKPDTGNQEPLVKPKDIKESKDSFAEKSGKLFPSEQKPKAAPPPAREKKHKMTPLRKNPWVAFLEGVQAAWNENRRMTWPKIESLTGRELKDLAEFWSHYGKDIDKALEAFSSGVSWASKRESWTDGKVLTLAELLAKSKLIQYAQKASHVHSEARQAASKDAGGHVVRVGATHAFQGAVNVKVLSVAGQTAEVENLETGETYRAYFDDLGAQL